MLLSEEVASSLKTLFQRFRDALPNMTDQELFNCLRILNKSQTAREKSAYSTLDKNGVGFTAYDAQDFNSAMQEYLANDNRFVDSHTRNMVRYRLSKYAEQLIRFWLSNGAITKVKRGEYSYESKAERLARLAAEREAACATAAEEFRKQYSAQQTPEYKAQQRASNNGGQLDFLDAL